MFETFISTDNFNLRKDFRGKGQPRFFIKQTEKKSIDNTTVVTGLNVVIPSDQ